jgi:hypothetical protein
LRLLAPTGLLRRFINRQRLIHTFVTNLRGPAEPLTFGGAPVRAMIAILNTTGNVTITFGAPSYAGMLRLTVGLIPAGCPTCRADGGPAPGPRRIPVIHEARYDGMGSSA